MSLKEASSAVSRHDEESVPVLLCFDAPSPPTLAARFRQRVVDGDRRGIRRSAPPRLRPSARRLLRPPRPGLVARGLGGRVAGRPELPCAPWCGRNSPKSTASNISCPASTLRLTMAPLAQEALGPRGDACGTPGRLEAWSFRRRSRNKWNGIRVVARGYLSFRRRTIPLPQKFQKADTR